MTTPRAVCAKCGADKDAYAHYALSVGLGHAFVPAATESETQSDGLWFIYEQMKLAYTEAMLEQQEYFRLHRRESEREAQRYDKLCEAEERAEQRLDEFVRALTKRNHD